MCGCILFTNIMQMLHATGRQTNKTQIISVTQMINKVIIIIIIITLQTQTFIYIIMIAFL